MPPWSNRFLSPNSRSEAGHNTTEPASASPSRIRGPSVITDVDILESAYGIPTLQVQGIQRPQRPSSHGRSMSHPFPSLFSSKKKRGGEATMAMGFDSTDDDSLLSSSALNGSSTVSSKHTKMPDKDLKTGRCMTCDSMVRWPKDLKIFRCTICLTINDLRPVLSDSKSTIGQRAIGTLTGSNTGTNAPHKVVPISLEKTRQLIDQCITMYLLERLKHEDVPTTSPVSSPPQSPQVKAKGLVIRNDALEPSQIEERDSHQHYSNSPIHLSGHVAWQLREESSLALRSQSSGHELPYSTSSPESIFISQIAPRDQGHPRRPSGPDRSRSARVYPSGDSYLLGKDDVGSSVGTEQTGSRSIFKPLEDYLVSVFGSFECINTSFITQRPNMAPRTASDGSKRVFVPTPIGNHPGSEALLSDLDAKTLLLGDFAENGSWWTGNRSNGRSPEQPRTHRNGSESIDDHSGVVSLKSPRIDWADLNEWYNLVVKCGRSWPRKVDDLVASEKHKRRLLRPSDQEMDEIEDRVMEAQSHAQRVLLKATENLLKRPGRPINEPDSLRFLLIILANPLLYPSYLTSKSPNRSRFRSRSRSRDRRPSKNYGESEVPKRNMLSPLRSVSNTNRGSSGQHSGIIKRILGILSNVPNECHHHLVCWFARFSDGQFQRTTDLIGSFVTYRLTRQHGKKRGTKQDPTIGLVPSISGPGRNTPAALHAALGAPGQAAKKNDGTAQPVVYNDDWQIKAAARVMALLFSANNSGHTRRFDTRPAGRLEASQSAGLAAREKAHSHGQILATSDFYNTLLDYSDLVADFEAWESSRGKFAFCQYPFFLSIWAKIKIMEHDAKRQMEVKAREAFFDSIMTRKTVNQYLVLNIRRECLVEDSLKGVSEVVGTGGEEIKKGLRIEFKGEEGIDAGGLRKEWFLLLVRDVFNPEHGMFTYDDDSHFCYFNPNSFETTDQFFLVGVVLGLAIYNSTILDVAFPPFAFRKLLAAGPSVAPGATSHAKPSMNYSLDDLAEFRPALANGLRQLLEYDGDVESTFCRDFVADVDRYGLIVQVPLCPDGERKPVTNANRREFVDLYVRYLLDTAVVRQFEPFKRGFFTVCGGNALSLFRPEEIELLIRGSDEPLDIASLRAVSICENWGVPNAADTEPVVQWFWDSFEAAQPKDQRKLLSFITGSDRIPATGATTMIIKLSCLGDDSPRFPVARTCFNMLSLWRYTSRQKLETMLWRAVYESEGFGLK